MALQKLSREQKLGQERLTVRDSIKKEAAIKGMEEGYSGQDLKNYVSENTPEKYALSDLRTSAQRSGVSLSSNAPTRTTDSTGQEIAPAPRYQSAVLGSRLPSAMEEIKLTQKADEYGYQGVGAPKMDYMYGDGQMGDMRISPRNLYQMQQGAQKTAPESQTAKQTQYATDLERQAREQFTERQKQSLNLEQMKVDTQSKINNIQAYAKSLATANDPTGMSYLPENMYNEYNVAKGNIQRLEQGQLPQEMYFAEDPTTRSGRSMQLREVGADLLTDEQFYASPEYQAIQDQIRGITEMYPQQAQKDIEAQRQAQRDTGRAQGMAGERTERDKTIQEILAERFTQTLPEQTSGLDPDKMSRIESITNDVVNNVIDTSTMTPDSFYNRAIRKYADVQAQQENLEGIRVQRARANKDNIVARAEGLRDSQINQADMQRKESIAEAEQDRDERIKRNISRLNADGQLTTNARGEYDEGTQNLLSRIEDDAEEAYQDTLKQINSRYDNFVAQVNSQHQATLLDAEEAMMTLEDQILQDQMDRKEAALDFWLKIEGQKASSASSAGSMKDRYTIQNMGGGVLSVFDNQTGRFIDPASIGYTMPEAEGLKGNYTPLKLADGSYISFNKDTGEFSSPGGEGQSLVDNFKKTEGFEDMDFETKAFILRTTLSLFGSRASDGEREAVIATVKDAGTDATEEDVLNTLMGYQVGDRVTGMDQLVKDTLRQNLRQDETFQGAQIREYSQLINEGKYWEAINKLETKAYDTMAKEIMGENFVPEETVTSVVKRANRLNDVVREVAKDEGVENWVDVTFRNAAKLPIFRNLKPENQRKVANEIASLISEYAPAELGKDITDAQLELYEGRLPDEADLLDNLLSKAYTVKRDFMEKMNIVREGRGLPALTEEALFDKDARVKLYLDEAAKTYEDPTVLREAINQKYKDIENLVDLQETERRENTGNIPVDMYNPGALRPGGIGDIFANGYVETPNGKFLNFETVNDGIMALQADINAKLTGQSRYSDRIKTLSDLIHIYAPEDDNNDPKGYTRFVANRIGVDVNEPIENLVEKIIPLTNAIAYKESGGKFAIDEMVGFEEQPTQEEEMSFMIENNNPRY